MIFRIKKNGFTLIEVLVAVMFLTLAITPAVSVSSSILDIAANINSDLIGALLAQEGIELVRFMRDFNWLACDEFSTGLVGGPFIIDIYTEWPDCDPTRSLVSTGVPSSFLNIDSNGAYSYSAGTPTQFRRTVTISQVSASELVVISEVTWTTKRGTTYPGCPAGTRCARAESHLYNWK